MDNSVSESICEDQRNMSMSMRQDAISCSYFNQNTSCSKEICDKQAFSNAKDSKKFVTKGTMKIIVENENK